jgi:hypothetical protein
MDMKWQRNYVEVYVFREVGKNFKDEKTGPDFPSTSGTLWIARFNVWKRYMFRTRCVVRFVLFSQEQWLSTGTALNGWFCIREALHTAICAITCEIFVPVFSRCEGLSRDLFVWRTITLRLWFVSVMKQKLGSVYSIRSGASARFVWSISTNGKKCVGCKTCASLYRASFVRENSRPVIYARRNM